MQLSSTLQSALSSVHVLHYSVLEKRRGNLRLADYVIFSLPYRPYQVLRGRAVIVIT